MDYFFDEEDEPNENIEAKDDMYNYKGYFVENGEEDEKKFYEFGAHFPYMYLYQRLEIIAQERKEEQKELENKLMEKEKESRDDPATNEESKNNDNLKDLLNNFQQKGKSRNRGDVGIGLTYMPKMNKKDSEHMDIIENAGIKLIKSTNGQNQNENIEKDEKNINMNNNKNDDLNINNNLATIKNNNIKKGNSKSKNKTKKYSKFSKQQMKIRKRNDNNLNTNNSINSNNVISINIFNKTKFGDKINSKNLTHDIPYALKIKNSLVNKLKSIQSSKQKGKGSIEQRLNNKNKMNNVLNILRNTNNQRSYSKCFGYQTKNTSSSKNFITRQKNKQKLINTKTGLSTFHQYGIIGSNCINISKNKPHKKSNISSYNKILNNNILSMKENNLIQNIKNNKKLFDKKINHKNTQARIQNNNYKSLLYKKQIDKLSSRQRKNNLEFIENIGIKTGKNNISRNKNDIPLCNNISQNMTDKNCHSVNNPSRNHNTKNNKINNSHLKLNFNNFSNLTQQIKPKKWREKNCVYNQISISNASLRKNIPSNGVKRNIELNSKKSEIIKKKIKVIDIQEKLKNCICKNKDIKIAINLKENKSKNISLNKNTFLILGNAKNIGKKNMNSRNRNENNNKDKYKGRTNNTLLLSKKKHLININININNQNNIILNKVNNNGINNNSINLCSVRSSTKGNI